MKLLFRQIRLIRCAYESLRCLHLEVWFRVFVLTTTRSYPLRMRTLYRLRVFHLATKIWDENECVYSAREVSWDVFIVTLCLQCRYQHRNFRQYKFVHKNAGILVAISDDRPRRIKAVISQHRRGLTTKNKNHKIV